MLRYPYNRYRRWRYDFNPEAGEGVDNLLLETSFDLLLEDDSALKLE